MVDTPGHTPPLTTTERRSKARPSMLTGGLIVFHSRTIDCKIRNLTEKGAKLSFASTMVVPDEFDLVISKEQRRVAARVVWRTNQDVGVVFSGEWRDENLAA